MANKQKYPWLLESWGLETILSVEAERSACCGQFEHPPAYCQAVKWLGGGRCQQITWHWHSMTSHLVVYELSGKQQPAPSCIAWRNQGSWGNVSFFCWKKNLFFSLFVVLLCLDLLFGEVRGVAGEVRLIFDLMAPFVLGWSPGKTFSPFGTQCFSWQRLCK